MKNKIWFYPLSIIGILFILICSCNKDDSNNTITDVDGNVYTSVTIDTQVWMVENLRVTHYRNGDAIPNVIHSAAWGDLTTGAYCDYDNKPGNSIIYGKLYNWYAVNDNRNIAPEGWHIPSLNEWETLIKYLGGDSIAGSKLKDTTLWPSPNTGANNSSGFSAYPGGMRIAFASGLRIDYNVHFEKIDSCGYWWTANRTTWDDGSQTSLGEKINFNDTHVILVGRERGCGFSVRCIKD